MMYLARVEDGKAVAVFPVDPRKVKMPKAGREKPRAVIQKHRARAWVFNAERTALCEKLSKPGAAAIAKRPAEAIAAAMNMYSKYQQAMYRKKR
jgi:hypothetical protein